jgi:hypothetical protein
VERHCFPGRCHRGGENIPPLRAHRLRIVSGIAALIVAAALAAYPVVYAGNLTPPAALLAGAGLFFALVAVVFRARFAVGVALFALAGGYVLIEVAGRLATISVAAYAVGLIVLAEVLSWPAQLPLRARVDRKIVVRWAQRVALMAVGAALLALLVLVAAGLQIPGAVYGAVLGAAAALLLLAVPWLLTRFTRVGG